MALKRVCIIEDDEVFRILCKTVLREKGFANEFIEFDDGHEALAWFVLLTDDADNIPDVILLDIKMPQMNGWQFLKDFEHVQASIKKQCCIYLLTSSVNEQDKLKASQNKLVKGYFGKPFQDEYISTMLKDLEEIK